MKRIMLIGFGMAIALISLRARAQTENESIAGVWYAEELEQSMIEVVKKSDGDYEGVIQSSSEEKYVGHKVIYDFKYDPKENHYTGTISSASRNMKLDGTIILEKDGRLKLTGKKLFMTRTFYWERKE